MRKLFLVGGIAGALFLTACSTTEQAGTALQSSWVGKPADNFFRQYGPPVASYTTSDGGKIMDWEGGRASVPLPGTATATTTVVGRTAYTDVQVTPGGAINVGCRVRLNISPAGRITSIAPVGDSIGMLEMSRCAEIFRRS